jgi:Tfp pilus assembly protein PilX
LRKQRGITVLVLTVMLLLAATLIALFAANYSLMQSRTTSNQYRSQQAFEAAEAGLEFGISYLIQNNAAITGSPSGGYIPAYTSASTTNVVLANNSTFSITYTNPIQNNYSLIQITSTGISDDGTSTHVVTQQVQYGSYLLNPSSYTLVTKGTLSLSGNTTVTNTQTNNTLEAGSTVAGSGSFKTVTGSGTSSTSGNFGADITQNVTSLANTANGDLFSEYFGMTEAQYQTKAAHSYSNLSNYSTTLNGITGTTIWINQTSGNANFSGNSTIGTQANPVLIVINGNLNISGNFTLYGFLFVIGASSATTNLSGNITITGGIASTDNVSASGNLNLTYDSSVLNSVQTATSYYAKVPGSWKDF